MTKEYPQRNSKNNPFNIQNMSDRLAVKEERGFQGPDHLPQLHLSFLCMGRSELCQDYATSDSLRCVASYPECFFVHHLV
jgi:hypothetical protein